MGLVSGTSYESWADKMLKLMFETGSLSSKDLRPYLLESQATGWSTTFPMKQSSCPTTIESVSFAGSKPIIKAVRSMKISR